MYIPTAFEIADPARLAAFMEQHSFATVVTQDAAGVPFASHIPLLLELEAGVPARLLGHLAKANPQWQHFSQDREVLVLFQGPHAYISPQWYQAEVAVPTWNYAAVHAYGRAKLISDESRLDDLVQRTVRYYEGDGPEAWKGDLPAEYVSKMLKAIVGFELSITRVEGKFKLGQNRSPEDIAGVYAALSQSRRAEDKLLAEFMREQGMVRPQA
jgi:transcriptional regulator